MSEFLVIWRRAAVPFALSSGDKGGYSEFNSKMTARLTNQICCLALISTCCYAQWPQPKTAMEAYDFVQHRRDEAEKLWKHGNSRGIEILNETLGYLQQPLVSDLASGNPDLEARRINIDLDLAEAYAIQGNDAESLKYLREVATLAPDPAIAQYIETQKSFDKLRAAPDFKAVLHGFTIFQRFWDSPALDTAFRDDLSEAEKLAGLGKFWAEVKYNFAFPDRLVALNWDALYLNWIPKVMATKSTGEYYAELMLLCSQLRDGHTNVYPPEQLDVFSKPPMRTGLVEGHVMTLEVMSSSLEKLGIHAGIEILAVDGVPAVEYGKRSVEPYQSASTPQDLQVRTFWYGFLRGPSNKPVRLDLLSPNGAHTQPEVPRTGYNDSRNRPSFSWRMLPGNIGYVALNSFEDDRPVKEWKEAFPEINKADALVLDLRVNGGGSSGVGYRILSFLAEKPFRTSRQVMRTYVPTDRARGTLMAFKEIAAEEIKPEQSSHYEKPIVVLAGPATFSAAEDFLVAWRNSGRGKIIGERSGGSTGQPLFLKLPGGGSARVCTKHDTFPDGGEWVGKGIEPDILVRTRLTDIKTGRDTVIAAALRFLSGQQ